MSRHVTSRHVTSRHVTSRHVTSLHFTSLHFTSLHLVSCHMSRSVVSCRVISRRVVNLLPRFAVEVLRSCQVTSHCVVSCSVFAFASCPVASCRVASCRVALRRVVCVCVRVCVCVCRDVPRCDMTRRVSARRGHQSGSCSSFSLTLRLIPRLLQPLTPTPLGSCARKQSSTKYILGPFPAGRCFVS